MSTRKKNPSQYTKPSSTSAGAKTKVNARAVDPFADREAANYANPLPSRELILQVMTEQGVPVGDEVLYDLLGIAEDRQDIFARRLNAMEREGQIIRNRKGGAVYRRKN